MTQAAFIITHHAKETAHLTFFEQTMLSLFAQSDPHWVAIIVDDGSPLAGSDAVLERWRQRDPARIHVIKSLCSGGAGAARNIGVRKAATLGAEIVLHCDNDDLCHPERLARTKAVFETTPRTDFVYTGFTPIDAENRPIPIRDMRMDMLEVWEEINGTPPEGRGVFPDMSARTGCMIVPSTSAMRIELALEHRFPGGFASEDSHTWMRMAAAGAHFTYLRDTELGYRMRDLGISDLGHPGRPRRFLWEKARNDIDGFECGAWLAVERGTLSANALAPLAARFLERLAANVARQGEDLLAARLRAAEAHADLVARLPQPEMQAPLVAQRTGRSTGAALSILR